MTKMMAVAIIEVVVMIIIEEVGAVDGYFFLAVALAAEVALVAASEAEAVLVASAAVASTAVVPEDLGKSKSLSTMLWRAGG